MNLNESINSAIASLCDDICGNLDAEANKKRAEAITLLSLCKAFTPTPEVDE